MVPAVLYLFQISCICLFLIFKHWDSFPDTLIHSYIHSLRYLPSLTHSHPILCFHGPNLGHGAYLTQFLTLVSLTMLFLLLLSSASHFFGLTHINPHTVTLYSFTFKYSHDACLRGSSRIWIQPSRNSSDISKEEEV